MQTPLEKDQDQVLLSAKPAPGALTGAKPTPGALTGAKPTPGAVAGAKPLVHWPVLNPWCSGQR
jgi:hypothetical protein